MSISFINPQPLVIVPPYPKKKLLTPQQLHEYQKSAVMHQLQHDFSMLWLGMGLGKTPITLTTIVDRMRAGHVQKTLIFGPLRVIQSVWGREARKWEHTKNLRFSIMHGTREKRSRALFADADIFLCNYENMNWLAQELDHYYLSAGKELPFQMVVYDEISKLKNSTTRRMQGGKRDKKDAHGYNHIIKVTGWRKMINHFKYRTGLTGTPASNGYMDLFGQFLALDGGSRLGEYVTHFKDSYFAKGFNGWKYTVTELGKQWIEQKIADITLKMDSREYLDMPDCVVTNLMVDMPPVAWKHYKEVEKMMFTELDSGSSIELFSKSTISGKLLQMCNGQPYVNILKPEEGFSPLHDAKLDALESVIEESGGDKILCSYTFKSDAERIMKRFNKKGFRVVNLTKVKSQHTEKIIDEWNSGKINMILGHPGSMGHGVDGIQDTGHIVVWFGVPWSLELYQQMNARVDRQGQTEVTQIIRILCRDTVDLAVADAIERKTDDEEGLKAALQRYRDGITDNELTVNFY